MNPKLVVISGPQEGQTFPLRGEIFTIGRQDGNDLQLLEAAVSRRHGEIRRVDDVFELHDLSSSHGSFVNFLPVHRHVLKHSDFIQIGSTAFLFLRDTASDPISFVEDDSLVARSTVQKRPEEISEYLHRTKHSKGSRPDVGLLLQISTTVQELHETEALVERVLELLCGELPIHQGGVFLISPESNRLEPVATRGKGELKPSRTLLARVREEGIALLWDDVAHAQELKEVGSLHQLAVHSLLCVPLPGRQGLHGVLYFQRGHDQDHLSGPLTEQHLELTAAAAGIAGIALDTVRSLESLRQENRRLQTAGLEHGMVGESAAMARLLDFIARVAPVDSTVLLRGESGTGKELVAQALHSGSPRADRPFVAINCATLSETLLESELFGHERGAFTGAVARKVGRLEAAHGGTLFLDEVGEIPPPLQARLLRALQERRFERLGGTRSIEVDVRVVAATNRNLEEAIRQGTFREDLFYRLNVITCNLPPLRERRDDIPLLARHFTRLHGERLKRPTVGMDPMALRALMAYDWPGNIRQLSNALERALVLGDGERIRPEDLPDELLEKSASEVPLSDFQTTITETKKRLLLSALEETDGNAAAAARALGLHPNSFRRLMRQLGLKHTPEA